MSRKDWRRPALEPLADDLRRIKITVSYDGSAFHGFQRQDNGESVQESIENALKDMKLAVTVQGSGRTDSGVHALVRSVTLISQKAQQYLQKGLSLH